MSSLGAISGSKELDTKNAPVTIDGEPKTQTESSDNETRSQDSAEDIDGDYGSYKDHIFNDPEVANHWANIYNNARYEGRHRFDPTFTWSSREEKRLKRKVWS